MRCEYANLNQRVLSEYRFDTLTNLNCAFYEVIHISTEKTNGTIQTHDTIKFHATQIHRLQRNMNKT
jgi:hypothetical protein